MKVVLSGIFFPMAIIRYFEAALRRRNDIELITAGPYTGTSIPWNGGMHLPQKYAIEPDIALPMTQNVPVVPAAFIEGRLDWKPDAWIQVDAGFYWQGKPRHGKNVIVGTDPHVLNYDNQRWLADTFYCMQTPYMKKTDEYLPYAFDPVWHRPQDEPRKFDVCLLGLHYQERNQLVQALRDIGVTVNYDLGPCFDEARELYNQAPIGLNWSSLDDLTARVFELLAMQRLAIVNRVTDLDTIGLKHKEHLLIFDNLEEAVMSVTAIMSLGTERIAQSGRKFVTENNHSWDDRVQTILEAV